MAERGRRTPPTFQDSGDASRVEESTLVSGPEDSPAHSKTRSTSDTDTPLPGFEFGPPTSITTHVAPPTEADVETAHVERARLHRRLTEIEADAFAQAAEKREARSALNTANRVYRDLRERWEAANPQQAEPAQDAAGQLTIEDDDAEGRALPRWTPLAPCSQDDSEAEATAYAHLDDRRYKTSPTGTWWAEKLVWRPLDADPTLGVWTPKWKRISRWQVAADAWTDENGENPTIELRFSRPDRTDRIATVRIDHDQRRRDWVGLIGARDPITRNGPAERHALIEAAQAVGDVPAVWPRLPSRLGWAEWVNPATGLPEPVFMGYGCHIGANGRVERRTAVDAALSGYCFPDAEHGAPTVDEARTELRRMVDMGPAAVLLCGFTFATFAGLRPVGVIALSGVYRSGKTAHALSCAMSWANSGWRRRGLPIPVSADSGNASSAAGMRLLGTVARSVPLLVDDFEGEKGPGLLAALARYVFNNAGRATSTKDQKLNSASGRSEAGFIATGEFTTGPGPIWDRICQQSFTTRFDTSLFKAADQPDAAQRRGQLGCEFIRSLASYDARDRDEYTRAMLHAAEATMHQLAQDAGVPSAGNERLIDPYAHALAGWLLISETLASQYGSGWMEAEFSAAQDLLVERVAEVHGMAPKVEDDVIDMVREWIATGTAKFDDAAGGAAELGPVIGDPFASRLGYADDDTVYVLAADFLARAKAHSKATYDRPFPHTIDSIAARFRERGWMRPGTGAPQVRLGPADKGRGERPRHRVFTIPRGALLGTDDPEPPQAPETDSGPAPTPPPEPVAPQPVPVEPETVPAPAPAPTVAEAPPTRSAAQPEPGTAPAERQRYQRDFSAAATAFALDAEGLHAVRVAPRNAAADSVETVARPVPQTLGEVFDAIESAGGYRPQLATTEAELIARGFITEGKALAADGWETGADEPRHRMSFHRSGGGGTYLDMYLLDVAWGNRRKGAQERTGLLIGHGSATPATAAARLATITAFTGRSWTTAAAATGRAMMLAGVKPEVRRERERALLIPSKKRLVAFSDTAPDIMDTRWSRALTDEDRAAGHIVGIDCRAQHLAAAQALSGVGYGEWSPVESFNPRDKRDAFFILADTLDDTTVPQVTSGVEPGTLIPWEMARYLHQIGHGDLIGQGWARPGRISLEPWTEDVRTLMDRFAERGDEAGRSLVKAFYQRGVGKLSVRGEENPRTGFPKGAQMNAHALDADYRPSWRQSIIGLSRVVMMKRAKLIHEQTGLWPVAIVTDCLYYATTEAPDVHLASGRSIYGDSIGQYRCDLSVPLDPGMIRDGHLSKYHLDQIVKGDKA